MLEIDSHHLAPTHVQEGLPTQNGDQHVTIVAWSLVLKNQIWSTWSFQVGHHWMSFFRYGNESIYSKWLAKNKRRQTLKSTWWLSWKFVLVSLLCKCRICVGLKIQGENKWQVLFASEPMPPSYEGLGRCCIHVSKSLWSNRDAICYWLHFGCFNNIIRCWQRAKNPTYNLIINTMVKTSL